MIVKFQKPFLEEIKSDQLKNGDIICITYDHYPSSNHYRIINNKWFNIFQDKFSDYFKPNESVPFKILRQNYSFTAKPGQKFRAGTEVFMDGDIWGDEESGYCANFRGWQESQFDGKISVENEICNFDDFDIKEL